jgi:signal transduction histidine kinase/ActR/RegA family two-component response regulator
VGQVEHSGGSLPGAAAHGDDVPHAQTSARHRVRLFHDDDYPAARIAEYLHESLARGGAAMAIATPPHSRALTAHLQELGEDVSALTRTGQLVIRDAEPLARALVERGLVRPGRFGELVRAPVTAALARYGSLRVYGEIVDLLCRSGEVGSAIELERSWNELLAQQPVDLLCGYAMHNFSDARSVVAFRTVCDQHAAIQPVAGDAAFSDANRLVAELQQTTAALQTEASRRIEIERERAVLERSERDANSRARRADAQAHDAHRRLELLSDSMDRIADARLDLEEVLDTLASEIARPDLADGCVIHLRDESGRTLRLAALRNLRPEIAADAQRILRETPVEVGVGIVGGVAENGVPVHVRVQPDMTFEQSRPEYRAHVERHPLSAFIVVPLRASGQLLGTLTASRYLPSAPFLEDDQRVIEQLASRGALAVENAMLYARAQQDRARAEAANRTKDEFLAMLGHELRNPLSPILTAVQLMRLRANGMLTKERTIIERQVNRMVRLVDDLLDVSRIARGKVQLKRAPVELAGVVAEAIEIASPILEERAHKLITSVATTGLMVDADADRLGQIIVNLLTNAAKYTPPGGKIEVRAKANDGMVALTIRDNGVGIEPHVLSRVFDLFAQAEQPSDRAQGGLGLGLSIARSLAELHDGTLHARSDGAGCGSEFTLELPLLRTSGVDGLANGESVRARARSIAVRRILVVDDNRDAAEALVEALEEMGHVVQIAHDGPSALEVARVFQPELALLDIGLPVMDGFELCRRMSAQLSQRPFKLVAVTGYGQATDRQRSRDAGFHAHLVKPVDLDRLEAVIDELSASMPADDTAVA